MSEVTPLSLDEGESGSRLSTTLLFDIRTLISVISFTFASRLLITGFIKEDLPLLPDPCHFQDYDRSMFPLSLVSRDAPRRCAQIK